MPFAQKPPASKRELVNRILAHDFNGDLRTLGKGAQVSRVNDNTVELRFKEIDRTFLISVHIPREGIEAADDEWSAELPRKILSVRPKQ